MEFYIPQERQIPPPEHIVPPELTDLPEEEPVTPEPQDLTWEEFEAAAPAAPAEEDRPGPVRRMLLIPLAATAAAVSMVFASFGYDYLGFDIFGSGSSTPTAPGFS